MSGAAAWTVATSLNEGVAEEARGEVGVAGSGEEGVAVALRLNISFSLLRLIVALLLSVESAQIAPQSIPAGRKVDQLIESIHTTIEESNTTRLPGAEIRGPFARNAKNGSLVPRSWLLVWSIASALLP